MVRRNLQKASQSRVFTIEDRAAADHVPIYQAFARATGITWAQGTITPVRIPDPKQYGRFLTVDKIKGQPALPTTSLEFRAVRDISSMLKLLRKGCPIDIQIHVGACKDPSDFDMGWEKVQIIEDADISNYAEANLGAFDADQEAAVTTTLDFTGSDFYEIKPLAFAGMAETQIVQEVRDVIICDSKTCGACGLPSDGCQHVFAIETSTGASPGLSAELVATKDGGSTWLESNVTSLPANKTPTALACVGPYLCVISNDDCSYHYALINDILAGTATWTKSVTGLTCVAGTPNAIFSLGRTQTWIVGNGGYIYNSTDITAGFTVQSAGSVTAQNLMCIHGYDENYLLAAGASNAIVLTKNGGLTWTLIAGPAGQAAVTINTVFMLSDLVWYLGYNDGKLYYTNDGGVTWTQKVIPGGLTIINKIQFSTRTVGYLIGQAVTISSVAKILRTINGGNSWYVLPETAGLSIPTTAKFNGLSACGEDPNVVWAGGFKTAPNADGILVKGA